MVYFEITTDNGAPFCCQGEWVPTLEQANDFATLIRHWDGFVARISNIKVTSVREVTEDYVIKQGESIDNLPYFPARAHYADKFHLHTDGRIKWIYWNPDGHGGKGQFVEHCLDNMHILKVGLLYDGNGSYDVGKFFELLNDYGKQHLHDNDGSEDFAGYEQWFIDNGNFHLFSCTADTMAKLHLFADLDDERRGELMKNLQKHTL